jgi:hypothetical protein
MIGNQIIFRSDTFISLCKLHKVKKLYAFGTIVNDGFNESNNIELLVELDERNPLDRCLLLLSLWNKFENYFDSDVYLSVLNPSQSPNLQDCTKSMVYSRLSD